jgi:DNA topoisomerase-1
MIQRKHRTHANTDSASAAGLVYVSDQESGITRTMLDGKFRYISTRGKLIRDQAVLRRIKGIVIPPAWSKVWICPNPHGHIQATGRDARGRKQYRYHHDWRTERDEQKFSQMLVFGRCLPRIRQIVNRDLKEHKPTKAKLLGAIVRLLELSLIRVGNEEYAKDNDSFGLTTMRHRHVKVQGAKVTFKFRGKSGIKHRIVVSDAKIASVIRQCKALRGAALFQYQTRDGGIRLVTSNDVNEYLRVISGESISAKDYRTWTATTIAVQELADMIPPQTKAHQNRTINTTLDKVSEKLGNTRAVCKKSYVHPLVLETYVQGKLQKLASRIRRQSRGRSAWASSEAVVLELLR